MISIKRYTDEDKEIWNDFNINAKNSLFMFDRNYMDYHNDRFKDHSLMFFNDGELVAIFPANEDDHVLKSHGGLTYGGFISNNKMKQHTMNDCFDVLLNYAGTNQITKIVYKTIPHIYHSQPAEEDRFSLFARGGKLVTVDVSTYLNLSAPLKMPKGRKAQISRAKREGVHIEVLSDVDSYKIFIELENEVLNERHNTHAVHTASELKMLHDSFPNNIHLFAALKDGKMIAGAVIYEYNSVIHAQYMAANEEARIIGALDLTIATIIETYKEKKKWLDFGISTEHGKVFLNEGLVSQKEGFGGRTGVYEIWELDVSDSNFLS